VILKTYRAKIDKSLWFEEVEDMGPPKLKKREGKELDRRKKQIADKFAKAAAKDAAKADATIARISAQPWKYERPDPKPVPAPAVVHPTNSTEYTGNITKAAETPADRLPPQLPKPKKKQSILGKLLRRK